MLYIDCFQLTKACLTAQWIVIRLKLQCKSFSFVLKWVFSPRVTGPKRDTAEKRSSEWNAGSVKGTLQARAVFILDSWTTSMLYSYKTLWISPRKDRTESLEEGGRAKKRWCWKRMKNRKRVRRPAEHPCHSISLEVMSGTLCCHQCDEV